MSKGTVKLAIEQFPFKGLVLTRVDVEIDYTATPYDPGNTSGPPENCYPPEGGEIEDVEFTVLAVIDEDGNAWSKAQLADYERELHAAVKQWGEENTEAIDEKCGSDAAERYYDDDPPDGW